MNLQYMHIDGIKLGLYTDGPVGISVSCGADSAMLLYWLMSNVKYDLHIYNFIADFRRSVLEPPFDNVVSKCAELTGKTNYFVHKYIEEDPPPELMFNMYKEYIDNGIVDIVYTGLTKFPPDEVYAQWEELPVWHVQSRKDGQIRNEFGAEFIIPESTDFTRAENNLTVNGIPTDRLVMDKRIYNPLINYNKQDVFKLYKEFNILDTLFPVTRSCENDNHPGSHCGKCWWCNERKWAFGYLE